MNRWKTLTGTSAPCTRASSLGPTAFQKIHAAVTKSDTIDSGVMCLSEESSGAKYIGKTRAPTPQIVRVRSTCKSGMTASMTIGTISPRKMKQTMAEPNP